MMSAGHYGAKEIRKKIEQLNSRWQLLKVSSHFILYTYTILHTQYFIMYTVLCIQYHTPCYNAVHHTCSTTQCLIYIVVLCLY